MNGRLRDKVAIITGGGSGIGRAAAELFAAEGARVLVADIDTAAGETTVASIARSHGVSSYVETDVADRESTVAMAKHAIDRWGTIDVLYCNAGIFPTSPIDVMTDAEWDKTFDVNVKSVLYCVQACRPALRGRGGSVLLTSSVTGSLTGFPGLAHYGASKAAMLGFMRSAALEFAPDGININAVMPGSVKTAGYDAEFPEDGQKTAACIPLGRLAEPRDIANAALFLVSPEASYITGQTLIIDGGQTLPELPLQRFRQPTARPGSNVGITIVGSQG